VDKKQLIALAILENIRMRGDNTPQNISMLTSMVKFVGLNAGDADSFVSSYVGSRNSTPARDCAGQRGLSKATLDKAFDTYDDQIDDYVIDNDLDMGHPDHLAQMINALLGVEVEWSHGTQGGRTGDGDKDQLEPKAGKATQEQLDAERERRAEAAAGALQGDANGEGDGHDGGGEDRPVMHSELPDILKAEADKYDAKLKKVLDVSVEGDMKLADAIGHLTGEVSELEVRLNKMAEGMRTEMGDQLEEFKTKLSEQARTKQPMVIKARGRTVELDADEVEQYHHVASHVFTGIAAGVNIALIGPAGCGKTKLCAQIADKLGLQFRFTGALDSPYKLTGFRTADGSVVRTPFREAYEHGGLFLLDEIDGSDPGVLLTLNAALANGVMDFPDAIVTQHEDFYAVAAANTFWNGRDREYVGRNQLDGSTVDRFMFIEMGYDIALESRIAPVKSWARVVQAYRKGAEVSKTRHIISQRATIDGGKLLLAGMTVENVLKFVLFKGLADSVQAKLQETAVREAGGRLDGLLRSVVEEVKVLTREVPEVPAMAAE
jgi:MoxR-like ATPase